MHALNRPILLRFKQPVWTGHKWRKCEDKWQELFGSKILFSLQAVNMNYLTDFDTTDLHDLQTEFHYIDFSADRRLYEIPNWYQQ